MKFGKYVYMYLSSLILDRIIGFHKCSFFSSEFYSSPNREFTKFVHGVLRVSLLYSFADHCYNLVYDILHHPSFFFSFRRCNGAQ